MQAFVNSFLSSLQIPSALLVLIWLGLLRKARFSGWLVAMVSLPGTVLHECSHFCLGLLTRAHPCEFNLFPKRQGDSWVLGSVSFTGLNIFNAFPVAYAPLLLLWAGYGVFELLMQPYFLAGNYLAWMLSGYVVACCLFSGIPSGTDVKVGGLSTLLWAGLGYGLWAASQSS